MKTCLFNLSQSTTAHSVNICSMGSLLLIIDTTSHMGIIAGSWRHPCLTLGKGQGKSWTGHHSITG